MDGIVMGGGVGVSAHGGVRVVTERSRVAMPETGIGFVPDVGGTWLLGRAPGQLGTHLALTGAAVGAADALLCGLADHFVPAARLAELTAGLAGPPVPEVVPRYAAARPTGDLADRRAWIDPATPPTPSRRSWTGCYGQGEPAAKEAAETILAKSPTALKVTLAAVRRAAPSTAGAGAGPGVPGLLQRPDPPDLLEGIRAQVVDKDRRPALVAGRTRGRGRRGRGAVSSPRSGPGGDLTFGVSRSPRRAAIGPPRPTAPTYPPAGAGSRPCCASAASAETSGRSGRAPAGPASAVALAGSGQQRGERGRRGRRAPARAAHTEPPTGGRAVARSAVPAERPASRLDGAAYDGTSSSCGPPTRARRRPRWPRTGRSDAALAADACACSTPHALGVAASARRGPPGRRRLGWPSGGPGARPDGGKARAVAGGARRRGSAVLRGMPHNLVPRQASAPVRGVRCALPDPVGSERATAAQR